MRAKMVATAQALADGTGGAKGFAVYGAERGFTQSHQFALDAIPFGGGQAAARSCARPGFLACGIGLPGKTIEGDMNGLRIGTPELVRWGMTRGRHAEAGRR